MIEDEISLQEPFGFWAITVEPTPLSNAKFH